MVRFGNQDAKDAGFVPLELRADQLDVLRRIEEAVRCAVQRNEALATRDVIEQRLLLLGRDALDIGVDH